jgi:YtcA family
MLIRPPSRNAESKLSRKSLKSKRIFNSQIDVCAKERVVRENGLPFLFLLNQHQANKFALSWVRYLQLGASWGLPLRMELYSRFALVLLFLLPLPLLSGCHSAPSRDILGSYFPSWMLCALIGISLAVIAHKIFVRTGIDEFIPKRLLVYPAMVFSLTFCAWLVWFGN